jgi:hypothetical protein
MLQTQPYPATSDTEGKEREKKSGRERIEQGKE